MPTICNNSVTHVTDQGQKVCREHASSLKSGGVAVSGLQSDAKDGSCSVMVADPPEEVEASVEEVMVADSTAGSITDEVTLESSADDEPQENGEETPA